MQRGRLWRNRFAADGQAPVQHGGRIHSITESGGCGVLQGGDGVASAQSEQGQVAAQHRPGRGIGDAGSEAGGGLVDGGHDGGAGAVFGAGPERIGIHRGQGGDPKRCRRYAAGTGGSGLN